MILGLVDEAVVAGARQAEACKLLGLTSRTLERWRAQGIGEDSRAGPLTPPSQKLSPAEEQEILEIVNRPEYRNLSPKQIVPALADDHEMYVASESTIYRVLRKAKQMTRRGRAKAPQPRSRPTEHVATGPNQVWSWDITYLKSPIRGIYYYLYMALDVWSRKIVGWDVHETETSEQAALLISRASGAESMDPCGRVLHADNGGPMKGATLLATLQDLGIVPSYSRPRVSDDNPYSESLFRTVKYRPEYPRGGCFDSLEDARTWVAAFVQWYNFEHRHSAIRFVTPDDRHSGREHEILARRKKFLEKQRKARPDRWSGPVRNCEPVGEVRLNPAPAARPDHAAARPDQVA
jgi:transposase InsO family protein